MYVYVHAPCDPPPPWGSARSILAVLILTTAMGLIHKIRNIAGGYSYSQRRVRDITAHNNSAPSEKDIANLTTLKKEVNPIMRVLYQRMNDKGEHWRHVEKALTLLQYLLIFGSEGVVEWYNCNSLLVHALCHYHQDDENSNEIAGGIRELADEITSLMKNKRRLKRERYKAAIRLEEQNEEDERIWHEMQQRSQPMMVWI